jgi:hypothetical protein
LVDDVFIITDKIGIQTQMITISEKKTGQNYSESVYRRRTDNTMAKSTKGQTTIYKTYT